MKKLPQWRLKRKLKSVEAQIDFEKDYGSEKRMGILILRRENIREEIIKKLQNENN